MTWIHIIHAVYTTTAKIYIHLHSRLKYTNSNIQVASTANSLP